MFFNAREEKDFKIILNVKSGIADLFVKPFYDDEQGEDGIEQGNLVKSLPKSKRDSVWILTDIDPKTSVTKKELLIVN